MENKNTLSAGKYSIELSNGPTVIYVLDEENNKQWVATTTDPEKAMSIVEGLILVEMKRFHYPGSEPKISSVENKPTPPFLRKSS
jgi:hypothetical protein